VTLRVRDGDTGGPLAGAQVVGRRLGAVVAQAVTDDRGVAELPLGTRRVDVSLAGYTGAGAGIPGKGESEIRLYDPSLQSPEYGGGSARNRYVEGAGAGPPDGRAAWSFESRTLIEFPPAVADGLAVFGTNSGRVYALDADSGDLRWARRQKGEIASTPAIAGDRVLVSSMDGALTAYGAAAGVKLWNLSTGGSPIESSPLVVGELAYVGAWDGRMRAVDVDSGQVRWTFQASDDIKGSAALAGDAIVFGDYSGNVYALDPKTGAQRWRYSGGQRFYGGPAVSGRTLVIGDVGGAVVALDTRTGAERWRHSTGGQYVYSTPAIADGRVFVGSYNGRFDALDLASGNVLWSFDAGGRISGSATVVKGIVYTAILYGPGQPPRTWGLDARSGAVRYRGDDGRYSPAVGAGHTLYLIGTRTLYAHRAPTA
jgi:outer membrane protein assembly factor BamB